MKNIILIISILVLTLSNNVYAQIQNTIGVTYGPGKNGIGILFHNEYSKLLFSVEKGTYQYPLPKADVDLFKIGLGTQLYKHTNSRALFLVNYNRITNKNDLPDDLQKDLEDNLNPISLEFVGFMYLYKNFGTTLCFDIINWEGRFGLILKL